MEISKTRNRSSIALLCDLIVLIEQFHLIIFCHRLIFLSNYRLILLWLILDNRRQ